MSGLDASFLYFETPTMHMHVCGTMVIDPSTAPGGWSVDRLRAMLRERAPHIEPFRRRVQEAALRLTHPAWVETHVDVDQHVRVVQCAAPGGPAELADAVAQFAGEKLDRSRPLWEVLVVEGLADGRVGIVFKVHHCAVDGVGAANVLAALFDLAPEGRLEPLGEPDRAEVRSPGLRGRLAHTVGGVARGPLAAARVVPSVARAVTGLVQARQSDGPAAKGVVPFASPRATFNGRISERRAVALVDVPVAEVKEVKAALGGTFNDVVLAVSGGALRRFLAQKHELPSSSLVAVVPVSVRQDDRAGNQTSAMFASLGTDLDDPVARMRRVHDSTTAAKAEHEAVGGDLLQQAAEIAPPTLASLAARAYSALRLADLHAVPVNFVLSNVPGPPVQIYLAGAAVESLYPLGPVLEGFGLNLTVASYRDRVGFGFIACQDRLPDLSQLADQVRPALDELVAAARAASHGGPRAVED